MQNLALRRSCYMKFKMSLIVCLSLFISSISFGQFGIRSYYSPIKVKLDNGNDDVNLSAKHIGIDYWFRLKNKRLEFMPELYYKHNSGDITIDEIGLHLNTQLYFLDIKGDCNCPTFGKQNDLIKKGLFLSAGLGWSQLNNRWYKYYPNSLKFLNFVKSDVLNVTIGVGLDLGVSNLLTLSPLVQYRFRGKHQWPALDYDILYIQEQSMNGFELGLRLGFRFDKKNYVYKSNPKRKYSRRRNG